MTEQKIKLVIAGLLHDFGKVIYRQGNDRRKHSQSGRDYLADMVMLKEKSILDAVAYHHADALKNAKLDKDSIAYLVYMADNIASATDRREKETEETGFEIHTPLQPVFNILNGNHGSKYYRPLDLSEESGINEPIDESVMFGEHYYRKIVSRIADNLRGIEWTGEYINSLLEVLEANLSFIPSSTSKKELPDISLFDHVKLTAALAACMDSYFEEQERSDFHKELFLQGKEFYDEKAFMLASLDVSGIQNFIYTITSKNALKTLRARSFYLEIMMEHIIDLILGEMDYSRTNLLYSGGGHCYLLLSNTRKDREIFDQQLVKLNQWFVENFGIALYIAGAYQECSSNDLKNMPNGSYSNIFRSISDDLSKQKSHRYNAEQIMWLNHQSLSDHERECCVCKNSGKLMKMEDDRHICPLCRKLEEFSKHILDFEFFSILEKENDYGLKLPGGFYLVADNEDSLKKRMIRPEQSGFVRAYSKNRQFTGKNIVTKLWVGDYSSGNTFEEFAKEAVGIDRIGVLRADVDNLGHAFVSGFENKENQNRYVTLSRTATLSRQLSLFFKYHINSILANGEYHIPGEAGGKKERLATIVYSGGDDLFLVGAWEDIIELAVDIRRRFERYTDGTLTLSGGIGVYHHSYPISVIAKEVAGLEDQSKGLPGKNGITLFDDGQEHEITTEDRIISVCDGSYSWQELENEVLDEKYDVIQKFFRVSEDRGKAFLYNLLELIRNQKERINFARFVYLLARLEPSEKESASQKENYRTFSEKMYRWIQNEKDCRQLKTAMNLYAYLTRETEGE